jgi:hypothetical protein
MWMQPAPAHHVGPMRMGLREPAWTHPLCRVASHALFGLGGWGPPRLVEQRNPGITGTTRQAKSPGRPENHPRALAGRTAVASGKSARLMPNSPPPVTPPSSRGSWPRTNRIKSDALAAGRHAGPVQVEGSRGKNATDRKPAARQPDISGKGMFGQRNDWNSRLLHSSAPSFLCHSSSDRTLRPADPPTINPQRNRKMSDSPQLKEATEGGSDAPACSVSSDGPTGTEIARSLGNREVACAVPLRPCPICGRPALLRYTPMHPGKYEVMCEAYWLPDTRACNGEESCPHTHLHAEPAEAAKAWNAGILEFGSPQNASGDARRPDAPLA